MITHPGPTHPPTPSVPPKLTTLRIGHQPGDPTSPPPWPLPPTGPNVAALQRPQPSVPVPPFPPTPPPPKPRGVRWWHSTVVLAAFLAVPLVAIAVFPSRAGWLLDHQAVCLLVAGLAWQAIDGLTLAPLRREARRSQISGPRVVDAAAAVSRGEGSGANPARRLLSLLRARGLPAAAHGD